MIRTLALILAISAHPALGDAFENVRIEPSSFAGAPEDVHILSDRMIGDSSARGPMALHARHLRRKRAPIALTSKTHFDLLTTSCKGGFVENCKTTTAPRADGRPALSRNYTSTFDGIATPPATIASGRDAQTAPDVPNPE